MLADRINSFSSTTKFSNEKKRNKKKKEKRGARNGAQTEQRETTKGYRRVIIGVGWGEKGRGVWMFGISGIYLGDENV